MFQDTKIIGALNNKLLFQTSSTSGPKNGFVAIGTDTYGLADYDNLVISAKPPKLTYGKYSSQYHQKPEKSDTTLYFKSSHDPENNIYSKQYSKQYRKSLFSFDKYEVKDRL